VQCAALVAPCYATSGAAKLGGGDKDTQAADIANAVNLAACFEGRSMNKKIGIADLHV
jgi:hypothetical protein